MPGRAVPLHDLFHGKPLVACTVEVEKAASRGDAEPPLSGGTDQGLNIGLGLAEDEKGLIEVPLSGKTRLTLSKACESGDFTRIHVRKSPEVPTQLLTDMPQG